MHNHHCEEILDLKISLAEDRVENQAPLSVLVLFSALYSILKDHILKDEQHS